MHCGENGMIRRSRRRKILKLTIGGNDARRYVLEAKDRVSAVGFDLKEEKRT
jgi:predicted site-specific integrase-resolvase